MSPMMKRACEALQSAREGCGSLPPIGDQEAQALVTAVLRAIYDLPQDVIDAGRDSHSEAYFHGGAKGDEAWQRILGEIIYDD